MAEFHFLSPMRTFTFCQNSEEDESRSTDLGGGETQINIQPSSGGGGGAEGGSSSGGDGAEGGSRTKPRGRPLGSKNKPKLPITITRDNENAMIPRILKVAAGCDIGESVLDFVQRTQMGLCVTSGSGTVASVILRRAIVPGFIECSGELLSMSGMYLPVPSSSSWSGGLTISLAVAGSQGKVVGGSVMGEFIAAGPVTIIAASFTNPQYHRMPAEVDEENAANTQLQLQGNQGAMAASTVDGSAPQNDSGSRMAIYSNPINNQLPSHAPAWATSARPPY